MDLSPYILLIKSKLPPPQLAPVCFTLSMVLTLIFSSIIGGREFSNLGSNIFLSTLSMLTIALSIYIYNDLTDIEVDRLNGLKRPLVTGKASKKDARNLVILLGAVGLTTAFGINFNFFLLMMIFFALFISYSLPSIRLKNKFLVKNLTIAIGTAMTYFIGSAATGLMLTPVILMATLGFIVALSTSILTDFRDVKGDKTHKVYTLPVVWGPTQTLRLVFALVFSCAIATVVGYLQLGFSLAFPILASAAFAAWIYVLYPLFRYRDNPSFLANAHDFVAKKIPPICFLIQLLTIFGTVL